ncbi:MAG: DUF222 domain-containing protein [Acidimicrobiaceae bacterium]|nr:DUF222 domain-containing protein [Acidimicrobiaceae bacterium]
MKLLSASDSFNTQTGAGCGEDLFVAAVDVAGLGDEGLSSRLGVIGRAESRLAAMKSQVLAEVERRHDATAAQRVARDELQSSAREAKRDVESAVRLSELSATSEALESGEIPQGHARLIARASGESDIDETVLVDSAKQQDFDAFVKTVRRHQQDQSKDDGQSLLERQRKSRKARIFESPETGMFVLSAEFDHITGARIATALTAKERQLWHNEDPKKRRTPQQRMADALSELVCEPGSGKGQGTDLLVIADYDVIQQQLANARLADGSPIPIAELHRMALDADILPSIFDAKTQNMWLGRARRTASEAQRVALMARDKHCVGCGANPLWCRAHHIIWWRNGGPTDLDNLLLVCDSCHHKIHEQGWTVHQHPKTRRYKLKPPASGPVSAQNPADRPSLERKRVTTMAFGENRCITTICRPPPVAALETTEESQQPANASGRPQAPPLSEHGYVHRRLAITTNGRTRQRAAGSRTTSQRTTKQATAGSRTTSNRRPATGNEQQATEGSRQPATSDRRPATGDRQRASRQPRQPATGNRQQRAADNEATGNEQPTTKRPATGNEQSGSPDNERRATGNRGQPTTGDRQRATGDRRPATGNEQRAADNRQRAAGSRRPATSSRQPTTGNEQAGSPDNERRATDNSDRQRAASSRQPATGNKQRAADNEQRAADNRRPATSSEQPTTSSGQPATSSEQPATGNEQRAADNRQPATGNEQRAAGNR